MIKTMRTAATTIKTVRTVTAFMTQLKESMKTALVEMMTFLERAKQAGLSTTKMVRVQEVLRCLVTSVAFPNKQA